MAGTASLILAGVFAVMTALGLPLALALVAAALAAVSMVAPLDMALFTSVQKMYASLDSFSLLAVPFFILSGVMMNSGGIALRLVEFAKLIAGRIPGALAQTNIAGNMLFGCISGSAIAASTSIGGVMVPMQRKEGYDAGFAAAINIASAPTGMLIPPTTAFIIYSLVSNGTSIAALFLGGAVAGILWGLACMVLASWYAWKKGYPVTQWAGTAQAVRITFEALPSLAMIVIVIGGIIFGVFTAVEASGIAVLYTMLLTFVIHRTRPLSAFPAFLMETTQITGTIMLLLAASATLSFAMALTGIPAAISALILGVSDNPLVIMLILNLVLLVVGCFMDMGPAILIFTPILLPIAQKVGVDAVQFGIIMVFNLAIGTITPPVGTGLFVGASVAKVKVEQAIRGLAPFYVVLFILLMLITYVPALTMALPRAMGL